MLFGKGSGIKKVGQKIPHVIGAHFLGCVRNEKLFKAVDNFGVYAPALGLCPFLNFFVQGKREPYLKRPEFFHIFGIFHFAVLIHITINHFGRKSNIFQLFYNNLLTTIINLYKLL